MSALSVNLISAESQFTTFITVSRQIANKGRFQDITLFEVVCFNYFQHNIKRKLKTEDIFESCY